MTKPAINRRQFNCESFISLLSAVAATSVGGAAFAQHAAAQGASTRRDVIKQELPGERALSLVEGHRGTVRPVLSAASTLPSIRKH